MFKKLTVEFYPAEWEALQRLVAHDLRYPKEQVRWLVRKEAQERGLWTAQGEEGDHEVAS